MITWLIKLLIYIGWIILWEGKVDKPLQRQSAYVIINEILKLNARFNASILYIIIIIYNQ